VQSIFDFMIGTSALLGALRCCGHSLAGGTLKRREIIDPVACHVYWFSVQPMIWDRIKALASVLTEAPR